MVARNLHRLTAYLRDQGFQVEEHPYSLNAKTPGSLLRIHLSTDERYQAFLGRTVDGEVLGVRTKIVSLQHVVQRNCGLTAIRSGASGSARKTN